MRVSIELGERRVFACALEWPGWARSGRAEEAALEALLAYRRRYDDIVSEAGLALPDVAEVEVVERVSGSGATDFGIPDKVLRADRAALDADEAARLAQLLAAAWRTLDAVVAKAPAVLRKGPRGGGRDRDQVVEHVAGAEQSYARSIGVRFTPARLRAEGIGALREEVLTALRQAGSGAPPAEKGWPARYAARRFAWHALDHAWEIEDKSEG